MELRFNYKISIFWFAFELVCFPKVWKFVDMLLPAIGIRRRGRWRRGRGQRKGKELVAWKTLWRFSICRKKVAYLTSNVMHSTWVEGVVRRYCNDWQESHLWGTMYGRRRTGTGDCTWLVGVNIRDRSLITGRTAEKMGKSRVWNLLGPPFLPQNSVKLVVPPYPPPFFSSFFKGLKLFSPPSFSMAKLQAPPPPFQHG